MAGPDDQPIPATRVAPADDAAPAAAAPAAEVVVDKAPAVAEAPVVAAEPALDVKPAGELTTDKPSLLDSFEKKEEPKKEEIKPAADAKTAEGDAKDAPKPEDKKAAAADKPEAKDVKPEAKDGKEPVKEAAAVEPAKLEPVAYEYALPETLKLDDAGKAEFHTALDGFRADPAKGAQALIDLHNRTVTSVVEQIRADQHKAFNETRSGWQKDVLADEQIGGAGHQTSMRAIARMRDLFVPEKERVAFDQFLRVTGAGDHPQFLKLLHQAARYIDEPSLPPSNITPPPNHGKPPGRRRDAIYDHPSSNKRS